MGMIALPTRQRLARHLERFNASALAALAALALTACARQPDGSLPQAQSSSTSAARLPLAALSKEPT